MILDFFFGLPKRRIIRSDELIAYHKFETGRPKFSRAKLPEDLPAPLQPVIKALQAGRPHTPGSASLAPGQGRYTLYKTAFAVTVETQGNQIFDIDPNALTLENETLYCNMTLGGWVCAMKPESGSVELAAFTSERCILKYLSQDDRARLLDKDWFTKGRFLCIAPNPNHFMQILNQGDGYVIEFRAGPSRPVNRTYESDIARIDAFLEGYLAGRNMNAGDYRFAALTGPDPIPGFFPARDQEGRWVPQRGSIFASVPA